MTTAIVEFAAVDWEAIADAEWYRIKKSPYHVDDNAVVYAADGFDFDGVLTLTYANPAAAAAEVWEVGAIEVAEYASEYGEVIHRWYWPGS